MFTKLGLHCKKWSVRKIANENVALSIALLSLIAIVLFLVLWTVNSKWKWNGELTEASIAQFGDFIGGLVGSLLAFSASLMYYVALKAQREEFAQNCESVNKQLEGYQLQVKEYENAQAVYKCQHETMQMQQFENGFYALFDIYLKLKDSMNALAEEGDYFAYMIECIESRAMIHQHDPLNYNKIMRIVNQIYEEYFAQHRSSLSHYFRMLYRLLACIENSVVLNGRRELIMRYVKILRAQMNENELLVIYYNIHSRYAQKSKEIAYKHNLLKPLPNLEKIEFRVLYGERNRSLSPYVSLFEEIQPDLVKFINRVCDNELESAEDYDVHLQFPAYGLAINLRLPQDVCIEVSILNGYEIIASFGKLFENYLYDSLFVTQFDAPTFPILVQHSASDFGQVYKYSIQLTSLKKIIID